MANRKAKNTNTVSKAVKERFEDVKDRFEDVVDRIEEVQEKFEVEKVVKTVKTRSNKVNDFMLENTEDLVNEAIVRSEQWQNVASKAVKGGLKLAANQQDIVFDTLEEIKGQIKNTRTRIKDIFSEILGPMGIVEYRDLQNKNAIDKQDIFDYINELELQTEKPS